MTSTYWKAGLLVSAFVGFGISLGAAQAQEQTKPTIKRVEAQPIVSVEGKDNFEAYCATCHGKEAKGNGPAAAALKVPPPDLTILARKNGGKFNSTEVEGTITGKNKITAKGRRVTRLTKFTRWSSCAGRCSEGRAGPPA